MIKIGFTSLLVAVSLFASDNIQPLTEGWAPYQIVDNKKLVGGISVDIVREIQKRVGNNKKIKVFPWNRSYNMTLKKKGFCLFSTARLPNRENKFKWVGPLADLKVVFFKRADNKKVFKTIEDAKKAKGIAVTKNDASEQTLKRMGFKNLQVKTGGSNEINIKKILAGKAELWPAGLYAGRYRIKQLGVQDKVVETKIPPIQMIPGRDSIPLYIAFNKNTPDSVIKKWQKALDDMKADGTYDKIFAKYK